MHILKSDTMKCSDFTIDFILRMSLMFALALKPL
uniref:Uncharacterized protein n=1 Tax=Rhizophora mucronata TaxID=61149 RepID=A0A2P2Q7Z3_RHIMU